MLQNSEENLTRNNDVQSEPNHFLGEDKQKSGVGSKDLLTGQAHFKSGEGFEPLLTPKHHCCVCNL
jgi:hypothetical protein